MYYGVTSQSLNDENIGEMVSKVSVKVRWDDVYFKVFVQIFIKSSF